METWKKCLSVVPVYESEYEAEDMLRSYAPLLQEAGLEVLATLLLRLPTSWLFLFSSLQSAWNL
jgi:hypothetical protein